MADQEEQNNDPGHDDPDAPVTVADKEREPTPYEKKLRTEAAKHRRQAIEAARDRDTAVATAQRERDEAVSVAQRERDNGITTVRNEMNARLIRSEMKAAALKAGMVDPDGLKMLDLSGVTMSDDGDVIVPDGFFETAKEAKPFLFTTVPPSSSASAPMPRAAPARQQRTAADWTDDEFKKGMDRLSRGQLPA